jgi:hypothetical protein
LNHMVNVVLVDIPMERELGDEHQESHEADRYGPSEPTDASRARRVRSGRARGPRNGRQRQSRAPTRWRSTTR